MIDIKKLPEQLRTKDIYTLLGYKSWSGVSYIINNGSLKASEDRKGWVISKSDFLDYYFTKFPEEKPQEEILPSLPFNHYFTPETLINKPKKEIDKPLMVPELHSDLNKRIALKTSTIMRDLIEMADLLLELETQEKRNVV